MNKVAILIPTMNRSNFLLRQLNYYSSQKFNHSVYIGDSSNNNIFLINQKNIANLNKKIKIFHFRIPNYNDRQAMFFLANKASEEFCAYNADDDILIPRSIEKCANFLKENKDYRTAQGQGYIFTINKRGAYGEIKYFSDYGYKQQNLELSAKERILNFANNYWVPETSIHRTNEFIIDSEAASNLKDKGFGELLRCFSFILKGKSKYIDEFHILRQDHEDRYLLDKHIDWITNRYWHESFEIFTKELSESLSLIDNISIETSKEIIYECFKRYFFNTLPVNNNNKNIFPYLYFIKKVYNKIFKKNIVIDFNDNSFFYKEYEILKKFINEQNN